MRKIIILVLAVCSIQLSHGSLCARGAGLDPEPVGQTVSASSVVAIGQISRFIEDADAQKDVSPTGAYASRINDQGMVAPSEVIRLRGTYTLSIQARLKGKCPDTIEVHLPKIATFCYGNFPFQLEGGTNYLLFLSQGANGQWYPVDPVHPLTPIAPGLATPTGVENASDTVIRMLIASLADPKFRGISTFSLSATRCDLIADAMKPYMDDPDLRVQDGVLCCLATNQVVEAIPRIAALQTKLVQARISNRRSVNQLAVYQDPAATPYLNLLLFNQSAAAREYAILALRHNKIADKSSIPFLIITLRDHHEDTSDQAYRLLHELIPELGPSKDMQTFRKEPREMEIERAGKWWADEVAGKHGKAPPLVRPRGMSPPIATTRPDPRTTRGPAD